MTVEELLKPRYKVIATYPDNKDFPIGKIIEFHEWAASKGYWEHSVEDCKGKREWLSGYFDDYPHIFKKLEWWEERDEKDMPEYVKMKRVEGVFKVKKYANGKYFYARLFNYLANVKVTTLTPTTKEEYEQSKQ